MEGGRGGRGVVAVEVTVVVEGGEGQRFEGRFDYATMLT